MNPFERALSRYREVLKTVVPAVGTDRSSVRVRPEKLIAWIQDYVVPAVDQVWSSPTFQELAAWPQRHLIEGASGELRELVKTIDKDMVTCARLLVEVVDEPGIVTLLISANPPKPHVVAESVLIMPQSSKVLAKRVEEVDELEMVLEQVRAIATRCWKDLVSDNEYFGVSGDVSGGPPRARAGTRRSQREAPVANVKLIPFFNLRLLPLGDLITRAAWARMEYFVDVLRDLRLKLQTAIRLAHPKPPPVLKHAIGAWDRLQKHLSEFDENVGQGEPASQRNAAIALAQVYIAFRPLADTAWMKLPSSVIAAGRETIKSSLSHMRTRQQADLIATALQTVAQLSLESSHGRKVFEKALDSKLLVLRENPPELYWKGALFASFENHGQPWRFILALVRQAIHGRRLTTDNYGSKADKLATDKNRAMELLPSEMKPKILTSRGEGYKLDLKPDQLALFESV